VRVWPGCLSAWCDSLSLQVVAEAGGQRLSCSRLNLPRGALPYLSDEVGDGGGVEDDSHLLPLGAEEESHLVAHEVECDGGALLPDGYAVRDGGVEEQRRPHSPYDRLGASGVEPDADSMRVLDVVVEVDRELGRVLATVSNFTNGTCDDVPHCWCSLIAGG